ncbi:MAG TPA: hypothetical protein VGQ51_13250 [Puia sp.]|jgi:hypothetical protein|nr:hypothetical protein [Puia sp.]
MIPTKIPSRYFFRTTGAIEIDTGDFLLIANHLGFRTRGGRIYRLVTDSRQVIRSSRTAYFVAMRDLLSDDLPDLADVLYAIDEVIARYQDQLIYGLEKLESFYNV